MADKFGARLQHAWSVFRGREELEEKNIFSYETRGPAYSSRPDRTRLTRGNERSIITAAYTRIAIDVASNLIQHVRVDEEGRYLEPIKGPFNEALSISANLDQTGRALFQDVVMSLFDEGCIAIVPTRATGSPFLGSYDIGALRVGKITQWYPSSVKVLLYNEETGRKVERTFPKWLVSIVENPLYAIMNEPNSTFKRLIRKLNILDAIDEQSGSGKLDIIIQLPYIIKTPARKAQAEERRQMIEDQLSSSKYGIAYTDGTEKITQLNRAAENNLMKQVEYLTTELYNQLGISDAVFNGTADEATMLNYYNRTLEPILAAIVDEMKRKFLTKTARTQGQTIMWFQEPFKLVPVGQLADIADKFTRNEILTSNEVRDIVGYRPVDDPRADELRNKNLNASNDQLPAQPEEDDVADVTTD